MKDRNIDEIRPYPKNAKKHPLYQIKQVAASIKEFGFNQPIVVDKKGTIIVGHARYEAAKMLKLKSVPVLEVSLSEEKANAYRLADNKLNESDWNMNLVIEELKGLDTEMIDLTGFDRDLRIAEGWNPLKTYDDIGDGINELVGYSLSSFWKDIKNENSEFFDYWIELPVQEKQNLVRQKYSRTNLEEIRRIVKTYMRAGDFFLENCCGWSTFASSAVIHGFSGIGVDIWDTAITHGKKQYEKLKGHFNKIGNYQIIKANGMDLPFDDEKFDFLYCNPPFLDEEKYSKEDHEIGNKNIDIFGKNFIKLQKENFRVLKNDRLCVITINDKREKGFLIPVQKYIIEWSEMVGFKLWDFVVAEVLSQKIRLRRKDYVLKRTVKCHEYIIIFKKP